MIWIWDEKCSWDFHVHTISKIPLSLSSPLSNQLSNVPVLRCSQVESCGNSEVHYLFKCANFPPGTLMCERKGNFEMIRLECNTFNWRIKYIIIYMSYIQLHIYVMGHSGKIIWLNFMMMLRWVGKRCEGYLGKRYLQLTWLQQQKTLLKNYKTVKLLDRLLPFEPSRFSERKPCFCILRLFIC